MNEPSNSEPLSFRAAAEALKQKDQTGRALKAIVLKREQDIGIQIATRLGESKKPHLRVTLSALFQYCPEFKPHRTNDDMTRSVRAYIDAIEERISEVAADKVQEIVMPHFREDRRRITQVENDQRETLELVNDLAAQVAGAVGAKKAG